MNLDHLIWPETGWGYMPPQDDVWEAFHYVQENYNPKHIFEIGFCWGHSTTYQLEIMTQAKMITCGPIHERMNKERPDPDDRLNMIEKMKEVYGERFTHYQGRTQNIKAGLVTEHSCEFDYALIDGDHSRTQAEFDGKLCEELRVPVVLVDNWDQPQVRDGVLNASGYKEVKVFDYEQLWKGKYRINQMGLCTL